MRKKNDTGLSVNSIIIFNPNESLHSYIRFAFGVRYLEYKVVFRGE